MRQKDSSDLKIVTEFRVETLVHFSCVLDLKTHSTKYATKYAQVQNRQPFKNAFLIFILIIPSTD